MSWQRWLIAAIAGTLGFRAAVVAIDLVVLGPSPTGNTGLYVELVIALLAGTAVAGLTVRARTATRWTAAFLITLLTVAGLGFLYVTFWMLSRGI